MKYFLNLVLALCLVIIVTFLIQYSSEDAPDTTDASPTSDD